MELKKGPVDNNQVFDNSSYYQSNDPFSSAGGSQGFGPDGSSDYYSEQGTYDPSMNPFNQINNDQPVNPYVQAGYGRVDLNDGYYNEDGTEKVDIDVMGMMAKTATMGAGLGGMLGDAKSGLNLGGDSDGYDEYHHHRRHHHHYYGRRYGYGYGYRRGRAYGHSSAVGTGAAAMVSPAFMNEVLVSSFLYMFIALLISGIAGVVVASNPSFYMTIIELGRVGFFLVLIVEMMILFACTMALKSDNFWLSATLFFTYALINGVVFSLIFLVFQLTSIVMVFFMSSLVFGVMAFYGAATKKDLAGWGPILFASLIGIIFGAVANYCIGNTMVDYVITVVGVIVFSAFTAYDVQKITKMSRMNTGLSANVLGVYGAMELYTDFVNLFIRLLRIFGKKK